MGVDKNLTVIALSAAHLVFSDNDDVTVLQPQFFPFSDPMEKSVAGGITQEPRNIGFSILFLWISRLWLYGVQRFEKNGLQQELQF